MKPALSYEEVFIRDLANGLARRQPLPVGRPASTRMFASAKSSRLTEGFGASQTSADSEMISSLRPLRARSREVMRDASFAKRAKTIVVNNVVGSGIGMQAQVRTSRSELNKRINDDIENGFESWSEAAVCHTGGLLHFSAQEQFVMGQVFEAGEMFVRKHYRPFGGSSVPFALEMIEPERVVDEFQPSPVANNARVRMGVEVDEYHRPLAYWIRKIHPGEVRLSPQDVDMIERVPANQIIHLRIIDRWPQTRSAPWLHTALRKLYDTDGYTEAEIIRARGQANTIGGLKTSRQYGEEVKDASGQVTRREVTSEAGTYEVLYEDEELQFPPVTAPNSQADPFLRFMLREIAAGVGVSYESLSRDYSQSNYSSSRLALLDDRDLWRIFQMWFIRSFRMPIHKEWLQAAVLSRSIPSISVDQYATDPDKFAKVRFKPRGWSWIDPTSEVEAYKEAIKAGLTTRTDVIAQTANGRDREDIDEERAQELEEAGKMGLVYDTDQAVVEAEIKSNLPPPPPKPAPDNSAQIDELQKKQDQQAQDNANRFARTMSEIRKIGSESVNAINARQFQLNLGDTIVNNAPPAITVNTPETRTTINTPVTVNTPETTVNTPVTVNTPETTVNTPVTVNTPKTTVNTPVTVNTPELKTEIKNEVTVPERELHLHTTKSKGKRTIKLKDKDGKVIRTAEMEE